jgi:hypothetical protein
LDGKYTWKAKALPWKPKVLGRQKPSLERQKLFETYIITTVKHTI